MAELHAIRSWLVTAYKRVPKALHEDRMGIVAFHHPEILAELSSMTYESRFLELLDELYFSGDAEPFSSVEKNQQRFKRNCSKKTVLKRKKFCAIRANAVRI